MASISKGRKLSRKNWLKWINATASISTEFGLFDNTFRTCACTAERKAVTQTGIGALKEATCEGIDALKVATCAGIAVHTESSFACRFWSTKVAQCAIIIIIALKVRVAARTQVLRHGIAGMYWSTQISSERRYWCFERSYVRISGDFSFEELHRPLFCQTITMLFLWSFLLSCIVVVKVTVS